ncbi:MAG: hypothetical protein NXI24_20345 [bacterium]|nr:hypothetical protein [bacterium]
MSRTSLIAPEAGAADGIPRLRRMAEAGEARFLIQFGGQGNSFLPELRRIYRENQAELQPFFEMCFDLLRDVQARADVRAARDCLYPFGFELKDWLTGRAEAPEAALFECPISFPGTTMLQLALLYAVARGAYPLEELSRSTIAVTGHSQGILAASIFAFAARDAEFVRDPLDRLLQISYDWLLWFTMAGVYIKRDYRSPALLARDGEFSLITDGRKPAPMAVVFGAATAQLQTWIDAFNRSDAKRRGENSLPIGIALINSPTVNVLAGHPADLCRFRRRYLRDFINFAYDWEYLDVSAPFHSRPHLREISRAFAKDVAYTSLRYRWTNIQIPLVSFVDGADMRSGSSPVDELTEILFHSRLDWDQTLRTIQSTFASPPSVAPRAFASSSAALNYVLDFGPGRTSATLTRKYFEREGESEAGCPGRDAPVEILSLNRASGMREFLE